jgi:hypothetical protein
VEVWITRILEDREKAKNKDKRLEVSSMVD